MSERMPTEQPTASSEPSEETLAGRLEELIGEKKDNRIIQDLIQTLRRGGMKAAELFLWNESDKFRFVDPEIISFCEQEIFHAGASRLEAATPWNGSEMLKAQKTQRAERARIRTEQEYLDACLVYALPLGWVKEKEKDLLIDQYLKPIYRTYEAIIADLRKEEGITQEEIDRTVTKMNAVMDSTRRIGSTDPNNIVKSVEDSRRTARNGHEEYAFEALLEAIRKVTNP